MAYHFDGNLSDTWIDFISDNDDDDDFLSDSYPYYYVSENEEDRIDLDHLPVDMEGMGMGLEEEAEEEEEDIVVEQQDREASYFYTLGEQELIHVRRFNIMGVSIPLNFRNMEQCHDVFRRLIDIFDDAFSKIFTSMNIEPGAQIGVQLSHPALDKNIYVPFQLRRHFQTDYVVQWIERVLQSHKEVTFDETITVKIVTVRPPAGTGRARCVSWKQWYASHSCPGGRGRSCFIRITKKGKLCCARALVVARARHEKDNPETHWNDIRRCEPRGYRQKRQALELMRLAGLENHQDACGPEELLKLQDVIPNYQIKVFDKDHCNALTFIGKVKKMLIVKHTPPH